MDQGRVSGSQPIVQPKSQKVKQRVEALSNPEYRTHPPPTLLPDHDPSRSHLLAPPERVPLGDRFVGGAAAAFLARDLTVIDLEPQTQPSTEVQGLVMLCPMVAAQRFLGLLHITLPSTLESDQLYTRVPMTLAHHAAMAFHAADLRGKS